MRSGQLVVAFLGSLLLSACSSGSTTGVDAGKASDSATGTDDSTTADASPLVMQCQAAAKNFATLCAGSDVRPCLWNSYAKLCATGNTQLLIDSMKCLNNTTCRTFSDPNDGAACLQALHAASESAAAKAFIQDTCTKCGGTGCDVVSGTAEIYPYLSDSDIAAVPGCRGTTCDVVAIAAACSTVPGLAPFAACK